MPSSLIGVLQRHCADAESACPELEPRQFTSLAEVLAQIPDPRRVRRYRLGSLLALCLVAVLGGATSLAAVARFAADTDSDLREQLGLTSSTPNASTLGRLLARLDGDALDDAVGAWLARYATDPVDEPGDTLVGLAVDRNTVRGSRTDGQAVHLLAAALHSCQTVIAQRQVAAKSNEIPAFVPLLDRIDLRGVVVADAMHTQRTHAGHVIAVGGHYLLVAKGNQKKLRKQLRRLPWHEIPLQARTTGAGHGRREVRRLKVCPVRPGLLFPHAVRAMEIKRRRTAARPARSRRRPSTRSPACRPSRPARNNLPNSSRTTGQLRPCTTSETSRSARMPRKYAPAPHPAPWLPCATSPSDSCAKQAGPTLPPQSITTGHNPITLSPCSDSQPENASPLPQQWHACHGTGSSERSGQKGTGLPASTDLRSLPSARPAEQSVLPEAHPWLLVQVQKTVAGAFAERLDRPLVVARHRGAQA